MSQDAQIKKLIEDFKKEANIEESSENFIAFRELREGIENLIPEQQLIDPDCTCDCDGCEDCEYN